MTLKITEHGQAPREILAHEAYEHLSRIRQEDVKIFRKKEDTFHPKSLILTILPIPPNCVRPSPTLDGDEVRGEDDITRRLLYILRVAKGYKNVLNENSTVKEHAMKRTQDAIHMYIDQTRMSTKTVTHQKSIASRLRGKQGRMRGSLMGKRCNFTARTVITGDANLDMREVGVPKHVAETLTVVEHVQPIELQATKRNGLQSRRAHKIHCTQRWHAPRHANSKRSGRFAGRMGSRTRDERWRPRSV